MEHISNLLSGWLIRHNAVKSGDRELYEYAIYSFLISVIPLAIFLLASGVAGMLWEGILIIFPFMIIRKFSGGYHAKHVCVCMFASTGLLAICLYTAAYADSNWIMHILAVAAGISTAINSPIDSENRKLTETEIRRYKHVTCLLVSVILVLYVVFVVFHIQRYSICIALSLILTAILQFPCILERWHF